MLRNNSRLEMLLRKGEVFGLIFTAVMLILVEACCVYWLNHIQLPDHPIGQSGFLVLLPWHRRPRFEVRSAVDDCSWDGLFCRPGIVGAVAIEQRQSVGGCREARSQRLSAAASVTAIAGVNLALATWLAR